MTFEFFLKSCKNIVQMCLQRKKYRDRSTVRYPERGSFLPAIKIPISLSYF
jgi:hypothetical protein